MLTIPIPKLAIFLSLFSVVLCGALRCSNITKEFVALFKPALWILGNSCFLLPFDEFCSGDRERFMRLRLFDAALFSVVWSLTSQSPLIFSCSAVFSKLCKKESSNFVYLISSRLHNILIISVLILHSSIRLESVFLANKNVTIYNLSCLNQINIRMRLALEAMDQFIQLEK